MTEAATLPEIWLNQGDIFFSDGLFRVRTLLGSCVSVTMFHRRSGLSGMTHAMFPACRENKCMNPGFYTDESIAALFARFSDEGVKKDEIEVKLFGGSVFVEKDGEKSIGALNVNAARAVLRELGMEPISESTGGNYGRKLYFYTDDGRVMQKRLTGSGGEI